MFFSLWWRWDNLSENCVSFGSLNFGDYFVVIILRHIFLLFDLVRLNYGHNLFSTLSELYARMHRLLYLLVYLCDLRYLLLYVKHCCHRLLWEMHWDDHIIRGTHRSILNTLSLFIFAAEVLNEIFTVFQLVILWRPIFNNYCLGFLRWLLTFLNVKTPMKSFWSITD